MLHALFVNFLNTWGAEKIIFEPGDKQDLNDNKYPLASEVIKDSNYIINLLQFGPFLHGLSILLYVIEHH